MRLLLVWILNALALLAVAYLVPSLVEIKDFPTALVAALVLGLINTLIRPVLALLTLPLSVITLGIFFLVLNGLLFWGAASLVPGFHVTGLWSGVFGGILYGVISWILTALVPGRSREVREE
jgi:putative membrane protein